MNTGHWNHLWNHGNHCFTLEHGILRNSLKRSFTEHKHEDNVLNNICAGFCKVQNDKQTCKKGYI